METYINKVNFSGSNGPHFYIELKYELLEQNSLENYSSVKYYLYLGSIDGYSGSGSSSVNCYINGETDGDLVGTTKSIPANSKTLIGTRIVKIEHDDLGRCNPNYSAYAWSNWNYLGEAKMSGSYHLPDIPRNFTETPTISVSEITTTSVTFTWSTSENCNWVRYYLDNHSSWVDVFNQNATNGVFTISNLGPNEGHKVYAECRRADSGLWKNSNTITFQTSSKTLSLKVNGAWILATPYLKINNSWKVVIPYKKVNGAWKRGK